jgi:multidrug transporter EmrE-like cation transporter
MNVRLFFLTKGMIILAVILNVAGIALIKLKLNEIGSIKVDSLSSAWNYLIVLLRSPLAVAGGIFILIAPVPYLIAVSKMDVSIVYPLTVALTCLILLPISVVFLGEGMALRKMIGVIMLIISVYLLRS